jgi:hypothetical protein
VSGRGTGSGIVSGRDLPCQAEGNVLDVTFFPGYAELAD